MATFNEMYISNIDLKVNSSFQHAYNVFLPRYGIK